VLGGAGEEPRLTNTDEGASDFGLKGSYGDDKHRDKEALIEVFESLKAVIFRDEVEDEDAGNKDEEHASEQSLAARSFKEIDGPIDYQADEEKLNGDYPPVILRNPVEVVDERFHESNPFEFKRSPRQTKPGV